MPAAKRYSVELSLSELEAAHIALSNYTAPKEKPWKQAAQGRACYRVGTLMRRVHRAQRRREQANG